MKIRFIHFAGLLAIMLVLSACQSAPEIKEQPIVKNAVPGVPYSKGPDSPPSVKGPDSPPPGMNVSDTQAVTEKEIIKFTLPDSNE